MNCTHCGSLKTQKHGKEPSTGKQRYKCMSCGKQFTPGGVPYKAQKPKTVNLMGQTPLTSDQLLEQHDMKTKVMKVLKGIPNTPEGAFFEKGQIAKMAGCSDGNSGFRSVISSSDCIDYIATTLDGKKIYFSHPDTIKKYKSGEHQIFRP